VGEVSLLLRSTKSPELKSTLPPLLALSPIATRGDVLGDDVLDGVFRLVAAGTLKEGDAGRLNNARAVENRSVLVFDASNTFSAYSFTRGVCTTESLPTGDKF
jgi:hypothetical protein